MLEPLDEAADVTSLGSDSENVLRGAGRRAVRARAYDRETRPGPGRVSLVACSTQRAVADQAPSDVDDGLALGAGSSGAPGMPPIPHPCIRPGPQPR